MIPLLISLMSLLSDTVSVLKLKLSNGESRILLLEELSGSQCATGGRGISSIASKGV